MRVLILTICGAVPLAILTLFSVGGLFSTHTPTDSARIDDQAIPKEMESAAKAATQDLKCATALASLEMLDSKSKDIPPADLEPLKKVAEPWKRLHDVRILLDQLQKPIASNAGAQITRFEQLLRQKELLDPLDKDGENLDGRARRLSSAMESAIERLKKLQDQEKDLHIFSELAEEARTKAEKSFEEGKYDVCIATLNELRVNMEQKRLREDMLEGEILSRLQSLKKRAMFVRDYDLAKKLTSARDRADKLTALLAEYTIPPSEKEKGQHQQAGKLQIDSLAESKLEEFKKQSKDEIAGLSPTKVSALVTEVAKPGVDKRILDALDREIKGWIETKLSLKNLDNNYLLWEAERRNGGVIMGTFEPMSVNSISKNKVSLEEETVSYMFREGWSKSATDWITVHCNQLRERPKLSTHHRYAERFDALVKGIVKEPASLDAWKKLEIDCTELNTRIREFDLATKSVLNDKLVFTNDIKFIKEVIKELQDNPRLFGPFPVQTQ